ncbi:MAG: hypothetical protein GY772_09410 [bacterium]|nr:hypothetical protein [bacterium]
MFEADAQQRWASRFEQAGSTSKQHDLQEVADGAALDALRSALADDDHLLMVNSLCMRGSAGFLTVLPIPSFGLAVLPAYFRVNCWMRLGLPVAPNSNDPLGVRALCENGRCCIERHNNARDTLYSQVAVFDPGARIEQRRPDEYTRERPADVLYRGTRPLGQLTYGDVCIASPLQANIPKFAKDFAGIAAERRADAKGRSEAAQAVRDAGHHFQPLAAEAFGGWLPDSLKELKAIARRTAGRLHEPYSVVFNRLLQRLSVVINVGTAAMVIAALEGQGMSDQRLKASHLLAL